MGDFFMNNIHTVTITVHDRNLVYKQVGEILHKFADKIELRVGYPLDEHDIAIIFLVIRLTNDELGAFTGRLGQISSVKVKANSIKLNQK